MMRGLLAVALTASLAFAVGPDRAAAQDARVITSVDTTLVTVGDRIRLTITVDHAAGASVVWPDSIDLSPFEVLAAEALPPSPQGERLRSGAVLTLTAFELGELEIPAVTLLVAGPGERVDTLTTDRFGVEVVSVGMDEGGDIRGIRGPMSMPVSVVRVSLWLLAALAALALAVWLYRRRARRGAQEERTAAVPPRPPHEVALEALDRIAASPLLQEGRVKEYHIEVSEVLRTYVEGRFAVPALEMTTREIVAGLRRHGTPTAFSDGLSRFLDQCDLVKFAKVRPDADASRGVLALGRELVESTVPEAAPGAEPAPAGSAADAAAEAESRAPTAASEREPGPTAGERG